MEQPTTGLRCRPGDLAIVTKCGVPERIGLLVRVLQRCSNGTHDWLVELLGPGVLAPGVTTRRITTRNRALLRDSSLTPIKGQARPYRMVRLDPEAFEASA